MKTLKRLSKQDRIIKFLEDRPCLNIKCLEIECNVPFTTITLAMRKTRDLPEKYLDNIALVLKKYGYK